MRVSVWQQDRKGARWRRLGVVEFEACGAGCFKRALPHGDDVKEKSWPRVAWYPIESCEFEMFSKKGAYTNA